MLGAIIGDIVGSRFETKEVLSHKQGKKVDYLERIKILNKSEQLLTQECDYTDDSVLTAAIAKHCSQIRTLTNILSIMATKKSI